MNITTLNKTINLFLIGSLGSVLILLLYFVLNPEVVKCVMDFLDSISSSASIIGLILSLPVAIFIGTIIEGITDTLRSTLKLRTLKLDGPHPILSFFCVRSEFKLCKSFELLFLRKLHETKAYEQMYQHDDASLENKQDLATGIFFRTANTEAIGWAVQHYSAYMLSGNYIVLLIFAFVLAMFVTHYAVEIMISILISTLISIYALCHFALEKFFIAREAVYKHAFIFLCEHPFDDNKADFVSNANATGKENESSLSLGDPITDHSQ